MFVIRCNIFRSRELTYRFPLLHIYFSFYLVTLWNAPIIYDIFFFFSRRDSRAPVRVRDIIYSTISHVFETIITIYAVLFCRRSFHRVQCIYRRKRFLVDSIQKNYSSFDPYGFSNFLIVIFWLILPTVQLFDIDNGFITNVPTHIFIVTQTTTLFVCITMILYFLLTFYFLILFAIILVLS